MQLLTNTITNKSPYGDFELLPDAGWKISQTFLDYESGLLVVNVSNEQKDQWKDTGLGTQIIPSKHYLIDVHKRKILSFEEWSSYFSYHPVTTKSEDGQLLSTIKRTHLAPQQIDIIQEEVVDIKEDKIIYSSKSMAFNEYRREFFFEQLEKEKKAKERRMK